MRSPGSRELGILLSGHLCQTEQSLAGNSIAGRAQQRLEHTVPVLPQRENQQQNKPSLTFNAQTKLSSLLASGDT